jgi:hypothetical protein
MMKREFVFPDAIALLGRLSDPSRFPNIIEYCAFLREIHRQNEWYEHSPFFSTVASRFF